MSWEYFGTQHILQQLHGCVLLMWVQLYKDESKEIPRPKNWGGFLVRPHAIEFWHGRPSRLHDRLRFRLGEGGQWVMERLAP